jgi:sigma-B regulation protein RsbU (phosphoserine phosphatase)
MAITHSLAHADPTPPNDPAAFLSRINNHLALRYTTTSGTFVTAFYGVFDPTRQTLTYCNAGHVPPRLIRWNGNGEVLNQARFIPLGIAPDDHGYGSATVQFMPGDMVLFATDGLSESGNVFGDLYGTDRVEVLGNAATTAKEFVNAVLEDVDAFTAGAPLKDDQTLLAVRCV